MIKPTKMIAELIKAMEEVVSFESSIKMAEQSTPELASNCRRFLLTKLNKKVEEIDHAIFGILQTQHAIFEAPNTGMAYFAFIRGEVCITKSFKIHETKTSQEWALSRTKEKLEEDQEPDEDGNYWSIISCDHSYSRVITGIYFSLRPVEGHSLSKQIKEWQDMLNKECPCNMYTANYIYEKNI